LGFASLLIPRYRARYSHNINSWCWPSWWLPWARLF